jgi:lysophospholipase L1-like esterase
MTKRARHLHEIIRATAARTGATYVDLYKPREKDPFARDPHRYHAVDGLHPADDGYALWFAELMVQSGLLGAAPASRVAPLRARIRAATTPSMGWAK